MQLIICQQGCCSSALGDAASQCSLHATLLRFRMEAYALPIVLGRRTGMPRAQRLCQQCNLLAVH